MKLKINLYKLLLKNMPEMPGLESNANETKVDYKAPKTIKQWCELYNKLAGRNVYHYTDLKTRTFGKYDSIELPELLTHGAFQKLAISCKINLEDAKLITKVDKKIQE